MAKTVKTRRKGGLTNSALLTKVREWSRLDLEEKQISSRKGGLRKDLLGLIERFGYEDDSGHGWLDLSEEVDGITALKRERAESVRLDEEAAIALVKERGLKGCIRRVEVLDQDAFMAAAYAGQISEDEVEEMTIRSITYRFKPGRARGQRS